MKAVFSKEFKSFFNNMSGYIFCAFMLLFAGIYTMAINLKNGSANFEYVLGNMSFVYLVAIPVLTMRIISEDRRQKTDQLYYSLPLKMSEVVLGKYFAMIAVLAIPTVIMALYPLLLACFGTVSFSAAYGSLFAFFLMGAALTAVGMFISSLTENQAISAVICLIVMLVSYYIGAIADLVSVSSTVSFVTLTVLALLVAGIIWYMSKSGTTALIFLAAAEIAAVIIKSAAPNMMNGLLPKLLNRFSIFERFYTFPNGIFDITALIYFVAIAAVFVYFTVQSMEKRRWS